MMALRHIALQACDIDPRSNFSSDLSFRSCFICHYLQHRLRKDGIRVGPFRMIAVELVERECKPIRIFESNLTVEVQISRQHYESLDDAQAADYFIDLIQEGVRRTACEYSFSSDLLDRYVDEFRENGYKNEWIHKRRLLKGTGLKGQLACALDTSQFRLTLTFERKKKVVWEKVILKAMPDELCFYYRFKDIVLEGDQVLVTSHSIEPLLRIPLSQLSSDS